MPYRSKTEILQELIDSLRNDQSWDFVVEYRPFKGWFMVATESRWYGDDGDWLGDRFEDALQGAYRYF